MRISLRVKLEHYRGDDPEEWWNKRYMGSVCLMHAVEIQQKRDGRDRIDMLADEDDGWGCYLCEREDAEKEGVR